MNCRRETAASAVILALAMIASPTGHEAAADSASYVPGLGDIMELMQQRHLKLWYAGREKNWRLADYELKHINRSFQDAMTFYPNLPIANMETMAKLASGIGTAINAQEGAKFATAFGEMTTACNNCHRSHGYGFIVVKTPTASPFSNEEFSPQ